MLPSLLSRVLLFVSLAMLGVSSLFRTRKKKRKVTTFKALFLIFLHPGKGLIAH
jgi:hypothetical protein